MSGERICLIPYSNTVLIPSSTTTNHAKLQLHLSNHRLSDHKNAWEVNCLNELTEWQINVFLQYDENQPDNVKSVRKFFFFRDYTYKIHISLGRCYTLVSRRSTNIFDVRRRA